MRTRRMMIVLLLLLGHLVARGQSEFVDLADRHVRDGDLDAAITEYYRHAYLYPDDPRLHEVYTKLGVACRDNGRVQPALRAFATALEKSRSADERARIRIELALAHMVFDQPLQAQLVLLRILASPPADAALVARAYAVAGVSALMAGQWNDAAASFHSWASSRPDSSRTLEVINALLADTSEIPHRSPTVATILSAIIPGAGQIYCGEVLDGLNSMALNGAFIYGFYSQLEQQRWVAAGLVSIPLVARYYMGNLDHAQRYANEFNDRERRAFAAKAIRRIAELSD